MKLPKPTHEIFCSTDSCNEHYGWEEADNLTQRQFDRCTDPRDHRYIYTKEQVLEIIEVAAVVAWNHYMDACKKAAINPSTREQFLAASSIRKLKEHL